MPFLSMVRSAALVTRKLTQRLSLSTQKRRRCRFGMKRRLVLLFACETWWPTIGALPVTGQTRAIARSLNLDDHGADCARSVGDRRKVGDYRPKRPRNQAV